MFEHVLIAVDGSACASRSAQAGIALAAASGGQVTAVAAAHGELDEAAARAALDEVESFGEDAGVAVTTHVVSTPPAQSIVNLADEVDAGLIVMGRHGNTGLRDRLFGSVTNRVLRTADTHVLTVPGGESPVSDFETILLPTDGSEAASTAVAPAADLADQYGAALHLLRVVDVRQEAGPFSAGGVDQAYVDDLLERELASLGDLADEYATLAGDGVTFEQATRAGTPSEGISEYVDEHDVDLVVMASTGESSLAGQLLGSTTDRVLRLVDQPVLVVNPNR
ncbi:universal stress protein [Haloarchaeobius sp. HME9146]|uniref:universal stress protein n=1 Tax=Haloarchaeobius sp. HME9146 TaxID=2978732 RepID=UPI0021C108EB|nr:universal stress protein [Haloarchaeobius sp. HME9146]MCT9095869.1 universal stress protein [Haloarchaeobius sp. HME9146]